MKQLLPGNAITGILKKSGKVFLYLLLLTGTICFVTAAPVVLQTPAWINIIFFITAVLLFIGGFRFCHAHWLLGIISGTFFLYFLLLTPQEQFADVKMQRIFAVVFLQQLFTVVPLLVQNGRCQIPAGQDLQRLAPGHQLLQLALQIFLVHSQTGGQLFAVGQRDTLFGDSLNDLLVARTALLNLL